MPTATPVCVDKTLGLDHINLAGDHTWPHAN